MSSRDHGGIATPIGFVSVTAIGDVVSAITIGGDSVPRGTGECVSEACDQLEAWFAGDRRSFDLPLLPAKTPRGDVLRNGMVAIGYGETMSYGALALELTSSPRAIGQACARNAFPIVVPCHRVLGAGGALGAYSAGDGPKTKAWLLAHERRFAGAFR